MPREDLLERPLSRAVIGAFYEVYNTLGSGFLEHLYVRALERELMARGHSVAREVGVTVMYKGENIEVGLLLHFGIKPSFYRVVSLKKNS